MLPDGADSLDSIFDSLSDNTLKNFIDSLDETERATITVGEAMQRMGSQTTTVTQTVARSSAAFKTFASIGKTLLSTLGNIALTMAATWAAGKVVEGVSNFINAEEIAIEKGKEAAETIRGIKDEINKKTSFNDENAERFGELREGVNVYTNENISLTNEEYAEYLSLCNQIAEIYPELVVGYNEQGQAILNLGSNAEIATGQLQELLDVDQQIANLEIASNTQSVHDGLLEEIGKLEDDKKKLENEYKELTDSEKLNTTKGVLDQIEKIRSGEQSHIEYDSKFDSAIKQYLTDNGILDAQFDPNIGGDGFIITFPQNRLVDKDSISDGLISAIELATDDALSQVSIDKSQNLFEQSLIDKKIQSKWNEDIQNFIDSANANVNYTSLEQGLQNGISTAIGNLKYEDFLDEKGNFSFGEYDDVNDYVENEFIAPIAYAFADLNTDNSKILDVQKNAQSAFVKLFNLDKTNLNTSEYASSVEESLSQIKSLFDEIYGDTADEEFAQFKLKFGFTIVDEFGDEYNAASYRKFALEELAAANGENTADLNLKDLTVEQIVQIETEYTSAENGRSLQEIVDDLLITNESLEIEPIKFSSLFGDNSQLNTSVDNFQSSISSIQSSLDALANGEQVDLTDLVQDFPELAGKTDDLQKSLIDLKVDKLRDFSEQWKIIISDLDGEELDTANSFFQNLVDGINLSDVDINKVKGQIHSLFEIDPDDPKSEQNAIRRANKIIDAFEGEMQDANNLEILMKLFADPSMANATIEELRTRYESMKLETTAYIKWDEDTPGFDKYNNAKQTKNAGDRYLEMISIAKEAQEAWENGLVGTDDFKTAASMFSPNGMEDAENWQENYEKIQRYFTEDNSGLINFLEDIEEHGLGTFNEETGDATLNLGNMKEAAEELGISYEALTAILGRLGDYGFTNDFFSTVEEGQDHLADLYGELAESEAKLEELKQKQAEGDTTVTDTVISEQEAKIQQIRDSITSTEEMLKQVHELSLADRKAKIESASRVASNYIEQLGQVDDVRVQQSLLKDLQNLNNEFNLGLKFEVDENGLLKLVEESIEDSQLYANNNPVEVPEKVVSNEESLNYQEKQSYGNQKPIEIPVNVAANEELLNYQEQRYEKPIEIPVNIIANEESINYHETKTVEVNAEMSPSGEETIEKATKPEVKKITLEPITIPQAEAPNLEMPAGTMSLAGVKYNVVNPNEPKAAIENEVAEMSVVANPDTVSVTINGDNTTFKEAVDEGVSYAEGKAVSVPIDGNDNDVQEKINRLKDIADSKIPKVKIDGNDEPARTTLDVLTNDISNTISDVNVGANEELLLQSLTDLSNTISNVTSDVNIGGNDEPARTALDTLTNDISNTTSNVNVGGDGELLLGSLTELSDTISNVTSDVNIGGNDTEARTKVSELEGYISGSKSDVNIGGDYSGGKQDLSGFTNIISSTTSDVSIGANTNQAAADISNNITSRTYTIDVAARVSGLGGTFYTGTMLSPAHASGTAYNMLNLKPAYANGKVALSKNEEALVNELGTESIIRDGVWSLIPGGMHVESLKKGDIILNAKQTKDLIESGKAYGNGKAYGSAYANGTAYNGMSAYNGLGDSKGNIFGNKNASTPSNTAINNNTTAIKAQTAATKDGTKASKKNTEAFDKFIGKFKDWIEVWIQRETESKDLNLTKSDNATTYKQKNKHVDSAMIDVLDLIEANETGVDKYEKQAEKVKNRAIKNKLVSKKQANEIAGKIQSGYINIEDYDEDARKFIDSYTEWWDKMQQCKQSLEDLKLEQKELAHQKFDNIVTEFDNMIGRIDHAANLLNTDIDTQDLKGHLISTKYYDALSTNTKKSIEKMESQRKEMIASLQASMDEGIIEEGSTDWYEMQSEIDKVTESIAEANNEMIEYSNNIREALWLIEDMKHEYVDKLTNESDFFIDLMSSDKLFDDKGNITSQGTATVGLTAMNYNTALSEAQKYGEQWAKVQAEILKMQSGDDYDINLINRADEIRESWQNASSAVDKYAQSIKDLKDQEFQAQLDALKELSDKYMDVLRKKKDAYDYQNNISEQMSNISNLEKRVQVYANDTSEEGRLKKQQAQKDLDDARKQLEETQYDKYISDQEELLNNVYTQTEEFFEMRLDNIDQLLEEAMFSSNQNSDTVLNTLKAEGEAVAYTMTSEMKKIWGADGAVLTSFTTDFSNKSASILTVLGGIRDAVNKMANISDTEADIGLKDIGSNTEPVQKTLDPVKPTQSTGNGGKEEGEDNSGDDEILKIIKSGKTGAAYIKEQRKAKNHSKLWKYIVDKYGHVPTYDIYRKLGKKLGVKPTSDYKKAKDTNALLKALKAKGYASGINRLKDDEWALTQEKGREILAFSDGSILLPMTKNSGVINNPQTEKILDLADRHDALMAMSDQANALMDYKRSLQQLEAERALMSSQIADMQTRSTSNESTNYNGTTININLGGIKDKEEFMNWLRNNVNAQRTLQEVVLSEAMGKGKLSTRKK